MTTLSCLANSLSWSRVLRLSFATRLETGETPGGTLPTIKALMSGVPHQRPDGTGKEVVTCLITDSRRVVPGALFFAIDGLRTNGNRYVEEAIDRGAVGIISEEPAGLKCPVTWLQVPNVRSALAELARKFYDYPDAQLELMGVTGTNGKTTVTTLLQFLIAEKTAQVGLIGTVRYDLGRRTIPSYKTTPESVDIYSMLDQMRRESCQQAVMEVSSHAIDQQRVEGLRIRIAVFLNLTQDHMDYHHDLETYFAVKARLFTGETGHLPEVAVINLDDPYGQRLLAQLPSTARAITFGCHPKANIRAEQVVLGPQGSHFRVCWPEGEAEVMTHELGHYNVSNTLAALAVCYARGMDLTPLAKKIASFPGVPGRMERIELGQPFRVLVDYAHTDDALKHALGMLREVTPGRLLVVFGCGGHRDLTKRPLMTKAVQEKADFAWATSDNPRGEGIEPIFEAMREGVSKPQAIEFVPDRRQAIRRALETAQAGDCVLIAGKGHETFQEFADTVVPFDDRAVAKELIARQSF